MTDVPYFIADMGVGHLQRKDGRWCPVKTLKEFPGDHEPFLMRFASYAEAEAYCQDELKSGGWMQPISGDCIPSVVRAREEGGINVVEAAALELFSALKTLIEVTESIDWDEPIPAELRRRLAHTLGKGRAAILKAGG